MKANQIHETIAGQIHNMKPADLEPGVDIGMAPLREDTLLVRVLPSQPNDARSLDAQIRLDQGRDLYDVTIYQRGEKHEHIGVYCDQLGNLVFGDQAEPFTLPMVMFSDDDGETWDVIA